MTVAKWCPSSNHKQNISQVLCWVPGFCPCIPESSAHRGERNDSASLHTFLPYDLYAITFTNLNPDSITANVCVNDAIKLFAFSHKRVCSVLESTCEACCRELKPSFGACKFISYTSMEWSVYCWEQCFPFQPSELFLSNELWDSYKILSAQQIIKDQLRKAVQA